jgi:hypothetical protein
MVLLCVVCGIRLLKVDECIQCCWIIPLSIYASFLRQSERLPVCLVVVASTIARSLNIDFVLFIFI